MNRLFLALVLGSGAALAQKIDYSSLDKLAARAKEVTVVSLSKDQLQGAMSLLEDKSSDQNDVKQMKRIANQLDSVEVHSYEFDKKGAFRQEDLDPLVLQLSQKLRDWARIVDTREKGDDGPEHTQIYMRTVNGKTTGLAIFAIEPKEITVVMLEGAVDPKDLKILNGSLGLPMMKLAPQDKMPTKED